MSTPTTSLYTKYAGDPAQNYERWFVPDIGAPSAQRLLSAAELAPGESVLDLACGTGVAARMSRDAVGPEGSVVGVDPNPGMLAVARSVAPEGIDWIEGTAEAIPAPDESVDVVLCSLGLQFFADRPQAAREILRVLKPGGRVAWATPGPTPPLFHAIDKALARHLGPGASMFVHAVFSVHDPVEARSLMEESGFTDVSADSAPLRLTVAPPADFLWQYVGSTPLAAAVGEIDEAARSALEADVVRGCEPFVHSDALVMEPGLLIVRAAKQGR